MKHRAVGWLIGLMSTTSACQHSSIQHAYVASTSSAEVTSAAPAEGPEAVDRALFLVREGRALAGQGLHGEALSRFEEARKIAPSLGIAHLEAALSAQYMGASSVEVAQRLDEAVARMPSNPRAQYQRAALAEAGGDDETAIAGYRLALSLREDTMEVWMALARSLLRKGAVAEAREAYARAVSIEPDNTGAQLGLAESAERTGDLALAERALLAARRMLPESVTLQRQLIAFFERTGQLHKAQAARAAMERTKPRDQRRLRPLKPSR